MAYENTNDGREFDWDDQIQNDGPEFTLLPAGEYPFTVLKFERGRFDGSAKLPPCKMAILTLKIDGGSAGETIVTHRLFLHSKCEGLLCSFFTAIGQRKHGEALRMNWNAVNGATGRAKIEIHEWTKNDGTTGQANQVKSFIDPPEETAFVEVNEPMQGVFM